MPQIDDISVFEYQEIPNISTATKNVKIIEIPEAFDHSKLNTEQI